MNEFIFNIDDKIAVGHEIEELSLDSEGNIAYDPGAPYDGTCSTVMKRLLTLDIQHHDAVLVPISIFDEFKMACRNQEIFIKSEHIWDYDLTIGDQIESMKLIWILEDRNGPGFPAHWNNHFWKSKMSFRVPLPRKVKKAFSFLRPSYLSYVDKPFWNPDALTQVNLVLAYHRTQKRQRKIEIFNICDLIFFKMAIDDNRYEYDNCEFHKIIDRTLYEHIQSGMYMKDGKFDLGEYVGSKHDFRRVWPIFEYLVHHFQKTIGSIFWDFKDTYPTKLANIIDIPTFVENCSRYTPNLLIQDTDSGGKCSEVLYKILTKSKTKTNFNFVLDCEWIYNSDHLLNEITKPLAECEVTIDTKNSFNFIENFINWLKFEFGTQYLNFITLQIKNFEMISPYVFNGLHIPLLKFSFVTLDYRLIRMLINCKYDRIEFEECRIANDISERCEFIGERSENEQNIFKFLNELHNTRPIYLKLEEHTVGILFAYVASVMTGNKLTEFQFKNEIELYCDLGNFDPFKFVRSIVNTEYDQIVAYSKRTGNIIDLYGLLNDIQPSDREEFDFYE